jgi:hypothetical protein
MRRMRRIDFASVLPTILLRLLAVRFGWRSHLPQQNVCSEGRSMAGAGR